MPDMVVLGDVNDDGSVDNLDITTFIGALSAADEAAFLTQFPNGNYVRTSWRKGQSSDQSDRSAVATSCSRPGATRY